MENEGIIPAREASNGGQQLQQPAAPSPDVAAAAERGWIDGPAVMVEQLTAIKRAGADLILTYVARSFAESVGRP